MIALTQENLLNNEAVKGILKTTDHLEDDKPKDIRVSGLFGSHRLGTGVAMGHTHSHEAIYELGNAMPVGWARTRPTRIEPTVATNLTGFTRDTRTTTPNLTRTVPTTGFFQWPGTNTEATTTRTPAFLAGQIDPRYVMGADYARTNTQEEQMRLVEENNVVDTILDEISRYEARLGMTPKYISLKQSTYNHYLRTMNYATQHRTARGMGDEDTFMGFPILCNPLQTRDVMVLGTPRGEMRGASLYQ